MAERINKQPSPRREDSDFQGGNSHPPLIQRPSGKPYVRPQSNSRSGISADTSDIDATLAANEASNLEQHTPGANLRSQEEQAHQAEATPGEPGSTAADDGGLYTGAGDDSKRSQAWNKAKGLFKNNKKKIVVGVGFGSIPIALLILALLFWASLAIPNFAQNMVALRLAKVSRNYARNALAINHESTVAQSISDYAMGKVEQNFGTAALQKTKATLDKINSLRWNRITTNWQKNGVLSYETVPRKGIAGAFGARRLVGIKIGDQSVIVPQTSALDKFNPTASFVNGKNRLNFYNALDDAIHLQDPKIPAVIRGAMARQILDKYGVSWAGLIASKFLNKSPTKSLVELNKEMYDNATDRSAVTASTSPEVNDEAQRIADEQDRIANNPQEMEAIAESGGKVPQTLLGLFKTIFTELTIKDVMRFLVKVVNPVFNVAVPVCMVYSGSKIDPAVVQANSNQLMRQGAMVLASSDQQENGYHFTGNMANALTAKFGNDLQNSNVNRIANGLSVDTSTDYNPQRSPAGSYSSETTIFNVVFGSSGKVFNQSADTACPVLTNLGVGAAVGAVNLGAIFVTGGGAGAGEGGAEAGADSVISQITSRIAARFATKEATRATLGSVWDFGKTFGSDLLKQGTAIAGATFIAKLMVAAQAGSFTNPLFNSGHSLSSNVDDGVNLIGNTINQQMFAGRPMSDTEVAQNQALDSKAISEANAAKSPFERYLALTNPQSLMAHIASTLTLHFSGNALASTLSSIGNAIFNPLRTLAGTFGTLNHNVVLAADSVANQNYGNVQFDFSQDEIDWINAHSDAQSSVLNQKVLDESGKEDEIASKYGACVQDDPGTLIANGDIVRDPNTGNVLDQGLCSKTNLGPHNPQYGDLVFRWRLSIGYNNTITNFTDWQNATTTGATN